MSEGESTQKQYAIHRSAYLQAVLDEILPDELGHGVTIYGWSMGVSDDHILRRVFSSTPESKDVERAAISVHMASSDEDIDEYCQRINRRIRKINRGIEIRFFDSASPGCWIYP